jgi:tetratricopeptide (TPR) repeat protein
VAFSGPIALPLSVSRRLAYHAVSSLARPRAGFDGVDPVLLARRGARFDVLLARMKLPAMALLLSGIVSVLCLVAPGRASAQAVPPVGTAAAKSPPSAALQHYNRGREHYQAGRYRDALQELEVAVNLDPSSPNLVYNVARVYELLGDIDQAIAFYRRYRDMLPANERAERERTVLTLQRLEGARVHVEEATPPTVIIERKRGVADAAFWSVASIGALALVGAGATGVLALTTEHESEQFRLGKDGGIKGRNAIVERADRLALASDVLLIGGASLGITAILLYVLRERTVTEPAAPVARFALRVQVWSSGGFLSVRGSL